MGDVGKTGNQIFRLSCIRDLSDGLQPLLGGLNSKKMLCLDTPLKITKVDGSCILFQLDKSVFFGGLVKWKISVHDLKVVCRTE